MSTLLVTSVFTDEGTSPVQEEENVEFVTEISDIRISEKKKSRENKEMHPSSAPGPDKIGPGLLQQLQEEITTDTGYHFQKITRVRLGTGRLANRQCTV